jgi:GT2 family glycosyltransferase
MKLSCIITTRNRGITLSRTLDHLEQQTLLPEQDWEVLVVDNGSTDDTAGLLSRRRRVRVISLAENEGVPARNLALASARGKYIAFLGDDVCPMGSALAQAISYLARHPKTAAVVGRVVLPDGSFDAPALPAVLMGGACVVRKSVLDAAGGFAAEFFRQAAEYELSFRFWGAGYRIERFEDLLFSREARPAEKPSELACRMDLRNNLILVERFLPRPLRHAYRGDWLRRYALLALHQGHEGAANTAIKEAGVWARREAAVGRKTLGRAAIESIFQIETQRKLVAQWASSNRIRRVCIADWGKNLFATWQACRSANLHVEAILDVDAAFAGAHYRRVPVTRDAQADRHNFDGIVISTLNPAHLSSRSEELGLRFGAPILPLWQPILLAAPPPHNITSQAGSNIRKVDKAA